jgi:hypothetical protein
MTVLMNAAAPSDPSPPSRVMNIDGVRACAST